MDIDTTQYQYLSFLPFHVSSPPGVYEGKAFLSLPHLGQSHFIAVVWILTGPLRSLSLRISGTTTFYPADLGEAHRGASVHDGRLIGRSSFQLDEPEAQSKAEQAKGQTRAIQNVMAGISRDGLRIQWPKKSTETQGGRIQLDRMNTETATTNRAALGSQC